MKATTVPECQALPEQTRTSIRYAGTIAGVAMAVTAMSLLCTTEESYSSFLQCVLICWIVVLVYYSWFEAPSLSTNKNNSIGTGGEVDFCANGATWSNCGGHDAKGGEWIGRAWSIVVVVVSASNAIIMCRTEVGRVCLLIGLALLAVVSLSSLSVHPRPKRCLMCGPRQRCEEIVPETDLQGGEIKLGGPRSFYNEEFGFGLRVQEGSLRPDTEGIHPVQLCLTSKAVVCDGEYMFVTRTAVFGPHGVTFDEPLLLCMEVREDETPVYTKDDGIWHKFEESDVREVYPCHRRVRHFLVDIKHFCKFGVATHPIRCRDITNRRFWSKGTHRFFTPRKIQVSRCSPPPCGPEDIDGELLCIVIPLQWVGVKWKRVRFEGNVAGAGSGAAEIEGDVYAVEMPERTMNFFASDIVQRDNTWETHIPEQLGKTVGLVLARVVVGETETTVKTFTQRYVDVGQHVEVELSKVRTESSPYPTTDVDTRNLIQAALENAGIRAPNVANPANATGNSNRSSSRMSTWDHLAVCAGTVGGLLLLPSGQPRPLPCE